MNYAKYQQLVAGQSSIAQKVLTVVPFVEEWDSRQIRSELLRVTLSAPDLRVVEGCLRMLVDAGLVKRLAREMFRRTPVPAKPSAIEKEKVELHLEESMPAPLPSSETTQKQPESVFDRMAALAADLRNAGAMFTRAAILVEDIALQVQQQLDEERNKAGKFRQLGSLLKELGVAE